MSKTLNRIAVFTFDETEVNILYQNGQLAYTFEVDGKTYGYKVPVPSKSVFDIASATFLLFQSFRDTLDAVKKL